MKVRKENRKHPTKKILVYSAAGWCVVARSKKNGPRKLNMTRNVRWMIFYSTFMNRV